MRGLPRGENVLSGSIEPTAINFPKAHCPGNYEYTPENT